MPSTQLRSTLALVIAILALFVAATGTALALLNVDKIDSSRIGVCRLRDDVKESVAASKAFLKLHPDGLPALGIPAKVLRDQIRTREGTVEALMVVECD